jgi:hypothetical protein
MGAKFLTTNHGIEEVILQNLNNLLPRFQLFFTISTRTCGGQSQKGMSLIAIFATAIAVSLLSFHSPEVKCFSNYALLIPNLRLSNCKALQSIFIE